MGKHRSRRQHPPAPPPPEILLKDVEDGLSDDQIAIKYNAYPTDVSKWRGDAKIRRPKPSEEVRFWTKVNKDGPIPEHRPDLGQCWLWTGAKDPRGYGHFYANGRMINSHRFAWQEVNDPMPKELVIDHLCRNPACVNPAHLEPVTQVDNLRRGRDARGGVNKRRTHCKRGHLLSENNVNFNSHGGRICRTCKQLTNRLYWARLHPQEKAKKSNDKVIAE